MSAPASVRAVATEAPPRDTKTNLGASSDDGMKDRQTARPHEPVMLEEIAKYFDIGPMDTFLDCTLGAGGHAKALLDRFRIGRYYGMDKDATAHAIARQTLSSHSNQVTHVHADFRTLTSHLPTGTQLDGALIDLGVSSMQLDTDARGFSFSRDGPLDMRMDARSTITAERIVNTARMEELRDLFRAYADDNHAAAHARRIVAARTKQPIRTTRQLASAIGEARFVRGKRKIHPATLPFQALRIAVNGELDALAESLPIIIQMLKPGARMAVLAFHSIEDRVVKNSFRDAEVVGGVDILTRKPQIPSEDEVERNPRARSAKLRVVEKLEVGQTPRRVKRNKYRS